MLNCFIHTIYIYIYFNFIQYSDQLLVNAEGFDKEEEFDVIVPADDPELLHHIRHAAQKGRQFIHYILFTPYRIFLFCSFAIFYG